MSLFFATGRTSKAEEVNLTLAYAAMELSASVSFDAPPCKGVKRKFDEVDVSIFGMPYLYNKKAIGEQTILLTLEDPTLVKLNAARKEERLMAAGKGAAEAVAAYKTKQQEQKKNG